MKNNAGKKKMPVWAKILLAVAIFLLLLVLGVFLVIHHFISKMDYQEDDVTIQNSQEILDFEDYTGFDDENETYEWSGNNQETEESSVGENESDSPKEDIDKADEQLNNNSQKEIVTSKDVTNILLIGVDRRDASWYGNSDSMILISINRASKKVVMTSLMRDTYVTIPNVKNYKLNHAMAVGGPGLLLQTVRQNFRVDVNYYMSVDFNTFKNVINIFGTIPVALNDAEINYYGNQLNRYYHEGNVYYLDGEFALKYARNRSVGRWDYERTERQRKIMLSLINQVKGASLGQINDMANAILPSIGHNIPEAELLLLLAKSTTYLGYDIISDRIPYDGLYQGMTIEGQGMLVPDWNATVNRLYSTIYS